MYTLYFISIAVFICYMTASIIAFGIPKSISDTYYHWEDKSLNLGILFTSFIWGITFPLMIVWIEALPNDWNFVPFIACSSLMFVGTAAAFKMPLTKEVHFTSAIIAAIASYTWSFAYGSTEIAFVSFLLPIIAIFMDKNKDNKIFWLELGAFVNMYMQLSVLI